MRKLRPRRFCIRFGCGGIGSGNSNNNKKQDQRGVPSSSSSISSASSSSSSSWNNNNSSKSRSGNSNSEIKWEKRPGGMLVQKREDERNGVEDLMITVRVSTVSQFWHDISIEPTSTFGELKMVISLVAGLEPREQRILFKGKEREDNEFLHMVGVGDKDKVLLLEDPAVKEMKLLALGTRPTLPITV